MLSPESKPRSFLQYVKEVFIPYLKSHTILVQRVDVVFDRHFKDSLKSKNYSDSRRGECRKVTEKGSYRAIGKHLFGTVKKKELFPFRSQKSVEELKD